jgi:Fe-S cluster biogenesis protein NfuA
MVPKEIADVFDNVINPLLADHGGSATPLSYEKNGGIVTIRMGGACAGCLKADETVNTVILKNLKEKCPKYKIKKIELNDDVDPEMWAMAMKILKGGKI